MLDVSITEETTVKENTTTDETSTEEVITTEETTAEENTIETSATTTEANANEQTGKYNVKKESMIKMTPLINSLDVKTTKANETVQVSRIMNKWAYISLDDGTQGWVLLANLEVMDSNDSSESTEVAEIGETVTEEEETTETSAEAVEETKTMYVNTTTANVREKADKTSSIITQLSENTAVTVKSTENGWCYVEVNGKKGYIAENLLSSTKQTTSRSTMNDRQSTSTEETTTEDKTESTTTASSTSSSSDSDVISYAKSFLGSKYVYGGTSPSGFDCSGFTQYVYKHFGVSLNRTAAAQYQNGTAVTGELQTGDLVMFGKSGINHVGIYIGGGTFIHAANSSRGVTTDTLTSGYYKTNYVGARRVQ